MAETLAERVCGIAERMYEARRALRGLWGANYEAKVEPVRGVIRRCAERNSCNEVQACLMIVSKIVDSHPHACMAVMAATVDVIELNGNELQNQQF